MAHRSLRAYVDRLRRTPLHPQWLLGARTKTAALIGSTAHGNVLDIGCADRWAEGVVGDALHYVALDYPTTGRDLYRAHPHIFGDATKLPILDGTFDTVLLLEVLEHLRCPRQALEEVSRVLRPGGRMVLTMPFLYPIHDAPHDYQRFTVHGLARELDAAGFHVDAIEPTLGAAETAGLLLNLAAAGMAQQAMRRRTVGMLFLPLIAVVIPLVNVAAWMMSRLLPSWSAMTAGYHVVATKQ